MLQIIHSETTKHLWNIYGVATTGPGSGQQSLLVMPTVLKKMKMLCAGPSAFSMTGDAHEPFTELYSLALCWIINHSNSMKHNSCLYIRVRNDHRLFSFISVNTLFVLHSSRKSMALKECCWLCVTKEGSSINSSRFYFCHMFDSPNVHTV